MDLSNANVVQFDKIPTEGLDNEVQACRYLKKHPPQEYLIKDVWPIVFSFLFGFTDSLILSVPLSEVARKKNNKNILFAPNKYVTHFFGIDYKNLRGNASLGISTEDRKFPLYVYGNYSLAFVDIQKSSVEINGGRFPDCGLKRRCLVQLTFDPDQMPKPTTKWFTWDRIHQKTFYSYAEACEYSRLNKWIAFCQTHKGRLTLYNKGYKFLMDERANLKRKSN